MKSSWVGGWLVVATACSSVPSGGSTSATSASGPSGASGSTAPSATSAAASSGTGASTSSGRGHDTASTGRGTTGSSVTSATASATATSSSSSASLGKASPDCTVIDAEAQAQIIDSQGNVWSIAGGKVQENGSAAGVSSNVTELAYVGGLVYQENSSGGWWDWSGATWVSAPDPVPGCGASGTTTGGGTSGTGAGGTSGSSTAGTSSGASGTTGTVAFQHKGVNGADILGFDATDLANRVAQYQQIGVEWVRFDFDWSQIQPDQGGAYQLTSIDAAVNALGAAGIQVLGILDYTPSWANGGQSSSYYPPTSSAAYAQFAQDMVTHYAPMGVHHWEIWNEENGAQFWPPAADPVAYVALLQAAYPAIKDADPSATVVTGGLSQVGSDGSDIDAREFLQDIYDNGGQGSFDAVGDHPYDSPAVPGQSGDNNWEKMFSTSPSFLSIMQAGGDGAKPIWVTEVGSPTNGPAGDGNVVSEQVQAQTVSAALSLITTYSWAGPLFWYNDQDWCDDASNDECFYGLIDSSGNEKPSYSAFESAPE